MLKLVQEDSNTPTNTTNNNTTTKCGAIFTKINTIDAEKKSPRKSQNKKKSQLKEKKKKNWKTKKPPPKIRRLRILKGKRKKIKKLMLKRLELPKHSNRRSSWVGQMP
jgi:hypothetical protein